MWRGLCDTGALTGFVSSAASKKSYLPADGGDLSLVHARLRHDIG